MQCWGLNPEPSACSGELSTKQAILPASKLNLDCDPFKTFSHKPALQSIVLHGLLARSGGKGFGRICSGDQQTQICFLWIAQLYLLDFLPLCFIGTVLADVLVWSQTPRWISNVLLLINMFCLGGVGGRVSLLCKRAHLFPYLVRIFSWIKVWLNFI